MENLHSVEGCAGFSLYDINHHLPINHWAWGQVTINGWFSKSCKGPRRVCNTTTLRLLPDAKHLCSNMWDLVSAWLLIHPMYSEFICVGLKVRLSVSKITKIRLILVQLEWVDLKRLCYLWLVSLVWKIKAQSGKH